MSQIPYFQILRFVGWGEAFVLFRFSLGSSRTVGNIGPEFLERAWGKGECRVRCF